MTSANKSNPNSLADPEASKADVVVSPAKEYGVFSVGDLVSVWSPYGRSVEALRSVAKVGARKMVLDDKSQWRSDGRRPYGASGGYGNRSVLYRRPDDELNWLRYCASRWLQEIICARLPEEDLKAIIRIADNSERLQRAEKNDAEAKS